MLIMQNLCHYYLVVPYYDSYYRIIICVPPHQCTLSKHLIIIIIITIITACENCYNNNICCLVIHLRYPYGPGRTIQVSRSRVNALCSYVVMFLLLLLLRSLHILLLCGCGPACRRGRGSACSGGDWKGEEGFTHSPKFRMISSIRYLDGWGRRMV